jgi:sodium/potassium-transporting ATPase subunit alpha
MRFQGYERPTEAKNIVFLSTNCISGTGKGVVIRTGKNSYMGQIAELAFSSQSEEIQLLKEIDRFILVIIAIFAISLGIGFFFR